MLKEPENPTWSQIVAEAELKLSRGEKLPAPPAPTTEPENKGSVSSTYSHAPSVGIADVVGATKAMTTAAASNSAHKLYDPDAVVPQNSPLLVPKKVTFRPSPSPPLDIPLVQASPPPSPGSRELSVDQRYDQVKAMPS